MQALTKMAEAAKVVHLAKGETLVRRGDPRRALHVVAAGLVEIERDDPPIRAAFGRRTLIDSYGALRFGEAAYDVRALAPSTVLTLRDEDFFDVMEDHFDLSLACFAALARDRERVLSQIAAAKR